MPEYNSAFFGLYESLFRVLKREFGEEKALELFSKVMEESLKKAYESSGFEKGNPQDFVRVVKERDERVGLKVAFPQVSEERIIYRFLTDPFPNLKEEVEFAKLDATYMKFKTAFLLGENWKYKTTKHFWKGDSFTEHVLEKK